VVVVVVVRGYIAAPSGPSSQAQPTIHHAHIYYGKPPYIWKMIAAALLVGGLA